MAQRNLRVGDIKKVSGEVNIAAGDIYKGYTAEQVSILLEQIISTFQPKPFDGRCPYKGLDVFEEEDAELFFGREKLVNKLASRVKESRTIFITGPSGSGKSSLVRAGLIYALKHGAINALHSERWLYETIKPGRDPLEAFALAFSRLKSPELANYFREHVNNSDILQECAESALSGHKDQRIVLFIDQFEEVFTQVGKEKADAFINLLTNALTIENGRIIILFAMRSDFVSNCATYPQLNDLLNQQFMQVGAMQPDELVSAIAQPALRVGLRIDPDLIAHIINDMRGEPGTLPLMQFALRDLFDAQQAKGDMIALTLANYLQQGGLHKALERHADSAFAKLSENEQSLARSIFGRLIEIGRGTQDTRRIAVFEELVPAKVSAEEVLVVIRKLADARLIITDEQAGVDTVTISHEKLIDAWPWLRKLVNENREVIALQNEISSDAKEWEDHGRDQSYLYRGARLASAREQLGAKKILLNGLTQQFIETSNKAHANELEAAQQRADRLRQQTMFLSVALVIALVAVAFAIFYGVKSQEQAKFAFARQLAAQAQSIFEKRDSRQLTSILLAIQSMKMFPNRDAADVLQKNTLAHQTSLMLHEHEVNVVAFSPNGEYVVSGSNDHTARVWEAVTGKEIARMTHDGSVSAVAFGPDGQYIVSGSDDHTARVWETASGKEVSRITHDDSVNAVAFSPDGQYIVSGSDDHTARVWETASGKEVAHVFHGDSVNSVAFSPDGQYVASGGDDHIVRVLYAANGRDVAQMVHKYEIRSVVFSPDGKYVASASSDNVARVWEIATEEEVTRVIHQNTADDNSIIGVAFSLDGQYVVSGSHDNTVRVWETLTGREVARMIHDSYVTSVAFSPDGKYVASGSIDRTTRVWEVSTGKEVARMTHNGFINSVAFSPDGKYVVSASDDHTIQVWESIAVREVARMAHHYMVLSVAFSPDSKYVVSGGWDGTTRVWEASTGNEISRVPYSSNHVAFSPDSKYVVSEGRDYTILVWEVSTGKEVAHMAHNNNVTAIAFSPNGKYVVSSSGDHTARVWDAVTGKEVARMTHDDYVNAVAFSPDGKYVVSGSWDHTARVWQATTGKEIAWMTHDDYVNAVAFSPNEKYIVSGSSDHTARVWQATTGKEIARMTHDNYVNAVAFSPDGKYIVSGSSDHTARVWQATIGKEIARMTHDDYVNAVAFSPDGKYIVSGSSDHTARVWQATTGEEVARMTHDSDIHIGEVSIAFSPDNKYIISGSHDDRIARVWIYHPTDLIADACSYVTRNLTHAEWQQYFGSTLPYQAVCPNLPIEPEATPTP